MIFHSTATSHATSQAKANILESTHNSLEAGTDINRRALGKVFFDCCEGLISRIVHLGSCCTASMPMLVVLSFEENITASSESAERLIRTETISLDTICDTEIYCQ